MYQTVKEVFSNHTTPNEAIQWLVDNLGISYTSYHDDKVFILNFHLKRTQLLLNAVH